MKLQRLLSLVRQAVDQYEMIEEGDHIAGDGGKEEEDRIDHLVLQHGVLARSKDHLTRRKPREGRR